jgi:hypothetical protein
MHTQRLHATPCSYSYSITILSVPLIVIDDHVVLKTM